MGANANIQKQAEGAYQKWPKHQRRKKKQQKRQAAAKQVRMTYHEYMRSREWQRKRAKAIRHHGAKCNRCGCTRDLQVHHKTYERIFQEPMDDLEVLCVNCHALEHEDKGASDAMTKEFVAHFR